MLINPISLNFESSRVRVSRAHEKSIRKTLKSLPELDIMARKQDVYFTFKPSEKNPMNTVMTIFKRGIDHIADVPEYALKHDTGDQVYINWTKDICKEELPTKPNVIIERAKQYLGFAD